jgi:hypothetical protein
MLRYGGGPGAEAYLAAAASTGSTPEHQNNNSSNSSPRQLASFWGSVVTSSKSSAQLRFERRQQQTRSQFRTTDGTGFVRRRIGEWEELFLCSSVSGLQLVEASRNALIQVHEYVQRRDLRRLRRHQRDSLAEDADDSEDEGDDEEEALRSGTIQLPELSKSARRMCIRQRCSAPRALSCSSSCCDTKPTSPSSCCVACSARTRVVAEYPQSRSWR